MKTHLSLPVLVALQLTTAAMASTPMPARFEGNRVLLDIPLAQGGTLTCYTDTGGGAVIVHTTLVERLGLSTVEITDPDLLEELPPGSRSTSLPVFEPRAGVPSGSSTVLVSSEDGAPPGWPEGPEGFLGSPWFAGHVWTWNYPARRFLLEDPDWKAPANAKPLAVGFKTSDEGKRLLNFPRIVIDIDGKPVSMLLDTGAETHLTPAALEAVADHGPQMRATSMITASRIAEWRSLHPDWRVIEKAQTGTGSRMIEVPDVQIAGIQVGPVWFTERADRNFLEFMSAGMDAQVEGAIGGNAFRDLEMTVDYPGSRAWFRKTRSHAKQ